MTISPFIASDLTLGQLNAIVKKLGGHEAALKFLRGELAVSEPVRTWREQDGIITFSVTSDGTMGKEWIARLEKKGYRPTDYAKSVLRSEDFRPTNGVTTEIAVLKGMLFKDSERITKNIRANAAERNFVAPNAEVACLIRELFTDAELEAMGLWAIVAMHEPIKDSAGSLSLLAAYRYGAGRGLRAYDDYPGRGWRVDGGFAFAVSQV